MKVIYSTFLQKFIKDKVKAKKMVFPSVYSLESKTAFFSSHPWEV